MTNEEIRPRGTSREVINNRLTTVETIEKLIRMGYTEPSARAYVKTGDVDKLVMRGEHTRLDGTETR